MERLTGIRRSAYYLTGPAVHFFSKTGVTPNNLSWTGFAITVGAAVLIANGHLFIAGFVVLAAGFFDMLDGALARHTGRVTISGAILDSILDRISEAILLLGVLIFYISGSWSPMGVLFLFVAMMASPLTSYVRAKAEAVGIDCKRGVFTRSERVIVLSVGLLISSIDNALVITLAIIGIMSFVTAGQRFFYILKGVKKREAR